jgi:quercetin dioxygenase-like cupin family protein
MVTSAEPNPIDQPLQDARHGLLLSSFARSAANVLFSVAGRPAIAISIDMTPLALCYFAHWLNSACMTREARKMITNVLHAGQGRSVWVVGDLYTFLATGEDTNGTYALIQATVPPGSGPPPHIHRREDEAFFVIEGELSFQVDGRNMSATPGAWVTLPKGTLHAFKNIGQTQAKMLILVNPSGLEHCMATYPCQYPVKCVPFSPVQEAIRIRAR